MPSMISRGRIKLPVWVVRMRSELRCIGLRDRHPPDHPRVGHTVVDVDTGRVEGDRLRFASADLAGVPRLLGVGRGMDHRSLVDPGQGRAGRNLDADWLEAIVERTDAAIKGPGAAGSGGAADLLPDAGGAAGHVDFRLRGRWRGHLVHRTVERERPHRVTVERGDTTT